MTKESYIKKYREDHPEKVKAWSRSYYLKNKKERSSKSLVWRKSKRGVEWYERYKATHREQLSARSKIKYAIKTGKIRKPKKCFSCGRKERVTAHHEDYSKPFDIVWLCYLCHSNLHWMLNVKNKNRANGDN